MSHPERERGSRLHVLVRPHVGLHRVHMDPPKSGKYWRSLVGNRSMTSIQFRAGG